MPHRNELLVVWAIAFAGVACQAQVDSDRPPPVPPRDPTYTLNFGKSAIGPVLGGNFNNFAFAIDMSRRAQEVVVQRGAEPELLVASFDYAACTPGQEALLEQPLKALAVVDTAWVDYIDVELAVPTQKDLPVAGSACFGLRHPSGRWSWHFSMQPMVHDVGAGRWRTRLWVKDGPTTGIKIVFSESIPPLAVARVQFVAKPYFTGKR